MKDRYIHGLEIGFILSGGFAYAWYYDHLAFNPWSIGTVFLIISSYVALMCHSGRRSLRDFGLSRDQLIPATRLSMLVLGPFLLGLIAYACFRGVNNPLHFAWALLLYPLWGTLQQFVFQGIFHEACKRMGLGLLSIPLTTLAFIMVHWPSAFMIKMTAIGGLLFSIIYHYRPHVIPLGVFHGVFGAFLYYVLRNKDPFSMLLDRF